MCSSDLNFLNHGALVFKHFHRVGDDGGNFRIDLGVTQGRAKGDRQMADTQIQPRAKIPRVIGKRVPIARIGQDHDVSIIAASSTVRVNGPTWLSVPMALGG